MRYDCQSLKPRLAAVRYGPLNVLPTNQLTHYFVLKTKIEKARAYF
jgi:hypothetical protein